MKRSIATLIGLSLLLLASKAMAVEVLSAKELDSHCKHYAKDNTSLDAEFCARYIQGFIDGAVATDARVMINIEEEIKRKGSFEERAFSTRAPSRGEYRRAARYAEFCLGDPVPLKEVVINVANDLKTNDLKIKDSSMTSTLSARDVVYSSLKKHYPCKVAD